MLESQRLNLIQSSLMTPGVTLVYSHRLRCIRPGCAPAVLSLQSEEIQVRPGAKQAAISHSTPPPQPLRHPAAEEEPGS